MKKVLILALALILLLGIAARGTFGFFSDPETSAGNTFTAWVEEVVCAKFNVSDYKDTKIYKYDDSGDFVASFDLSGDSGFPVGVAAVEGDIYVLDHPDHRVYQYTCSGTWVDVSKDLLKLGGPSSIGLSQGLAIYGTQMWVVSGNDKNIYQYPLSAVFPGPGTLNAAQEIALDKGNKGAEALAIDSNYLYVLDYDTSGKETRFYRYPYPAGTPVTVSKVLNDMASNPLQSPAGAMFDGTSLWVVDSGTNKVYEYNLTELFDGIGTTLNAASEFDLDSNNSDASGV